MQKEVTEDTEIKVEEKEVSKRKPLVQEETDIYKVDVSKKEEKDEPKKEPEAVDEVKVDESIEKDIDDVLTKIIDNEEKEEVLKEEKDSIKVDDTIEDEVKVKDIEDKNDKVDLPPDVEGYLKFKEETGGSMEEYVRLSADYSNTSDNALLKEYYKSTKPNLSNEDIDFLIEDRFGFDEEIDEDRDVRKKKLALKETLGDAKAHLEGLKDKYYKEVKSGSKLTPEQKEALDFYTQYKEQEKTSIKEVEQRRKAFNETAANLFNDEFKGFEFKVGEDKYRYNIKDASKVKEVQSDITNVLGSYFDKNGNLADAKGYHKALFAASNPDGIAEHFYEQGRADAIKAESARDKNIDMDGRKQNQEYVSAKGIKVRVINGDSDSNLRIKKSISDKFKKKN